jgi:cation diffusion facilitator CzcD-associated flavoprotein CzcO
MAMSRHTELLIIGAGPFGLAMAAYASHHHMDYLVVGHPMSFWHTHMPQGMCLRSACDWHLDPLKIHTIEAYLHTQQLRPADVEPLSRDVYVRYALWFQQQKRIEPLCMSVEQLNSSPDAPHIFEAILADGEMITARNVLLAVGFQYFQHIPDELAQTIPPGYFLHTCDCVRFDAFQGKRCLIIGGRQSAFEWAALLHEHGAAAIHVSHRHATPEFRRSDWSWVGPLVEAMVDDPGWFRRLTVEEKQALNQRFWAEGRLKLEPWLKPRIDHDPIKIWPTSQVVSCQQLPQGALEVTLSVGERLTVDHFILATGYQVNMANIPFLRRGNILPRLQRHNGYPVLDEHFQSNLPGLFITSMAATQDFGAFFAFTVSVGASARIIGSFLKSPVAR